MGLVEIKIIIPGQAIVKKNTVRHSMFYKDKFGRNIPRPAPLVYYTKPYTEWAKGAIIACANFKTTHPDIEFPLSGQYNLACKFVYAENKKVDISNLLEGVQDVLAGNAGACKDSVPSEYYQIIEDDSVRFICSLDGCRFIYSPSEKPRTEVILTDFKW